MKKLDIQSMILQCGENETVVLPKGEYESGPFIRYIAGMCMQKV